jgi:hypothetical protein
MADPNDQCAAYAIRVEGELGPLLLSSLAPSWGSHTEEPTVVILSVTDDDLVDVAVKLARFGMEIDSVRTIATHPA